MTAEITHNHPEGIKGAEATAFAVFLARTGHDKEAIRASIKTLFDYDLDRTVDGIRLFTPSTYPAKGLSPKRSLPFLIRSRVK